MPGMGVQRVQTTVSQHFRVSATEQGKLYSLTVRQFNISYMFSQYVTLQLQTLRWLPFTDIQPDRFTNWCYGTEILHVDNLFRYHVQSMSVRYSDEFRISERGAKGESSLVTCYFGMLPCRGLTRNNF